jgi:hypothetical protein
MDVLRETRQTQMQIPLTVIEKFFRIPRDEDGAIGLSIVTDRGITQPIIRKVVRSTGRSGRRLMRRLEMPQIKGLKRPLAVMFVRLAGRRRFAYMLVAQSDSRYRKIDQLLDKEGQQGRKVRRFLIGRVGDKKWGAVRSLLPTTWQASVRRAQEMD